MIYSHMYTQNTRLWASLVAYLTGNDVSGGVKIKELIKGQEGFSLVHPEGRFNPLRKKFMIGQIKILSWIGGGVMAPKNKISPKQAVPEDWYQEGLISKKLPRYKIIIGAISLTPHPVGVIITVETHDRVPIGEEPEKLLGAGSHDTIVFLDSLGLQISEEDLVKGIEFPIVHDLELPVGSVQPEELRLPLHHPVLLEGPVEELQA